MKIMIVDDSMVIRRKIERCDLITDLAVDSDDIKQATNGLEAISLFSRFRPDFVTMDLTMPEMDGVESVQKIMAQDPDAQILVISALTDKSTALQAIRYGARGFLPKPFTEEQLSNAISSILQNT